MHRARLALEKTNAQWRMLLNVCPIQSKRWSASKPPGAPPAHAAGDASPPGRHMISESVNGRQRTYGVDAGGKLSHQWSVGSTGLSSRFRFSMKQMLLPAGYPDSVHGSYTGYHKWTFSESIFTGAQFFLTNQV